VPALVRKLKQYDHNKDWYLGKPSIPEPLEIMDREHNNVSISFTQNKLLLCKPNLIGNKKIVLIK
jgi:hypothetical protein